MEIRPESYILIQHWMVSELGLKGNELLIYAIIHGFSQDGASKFTGSLQYLADWCHSTRRGVLKTLQTLVEKGLIAKEDFWVGKSKVCKYQTTSRCGELSSTVVNSVHRGGELSSTVVVNSVHQGGELSSPNNIDNILADNIDNNISIGESAKKEGKHKHGQYKNVLLSDAEMDKLKAEFPADYQERIERLSEYMESTGRHYKSHLATIRAWARKDGKYDGKQNPGTGSSRWAGLHIPSIDG